MKKQKTLYIVAAAIGLLFLLRRSGGVPPPSAAWNITSTPGGGLVPIMDPINFIVRGTAGMTVSILTRKEGNSNLFGWRKAEGSSSGIIAPDGTFSFTTSLYEQFGFIYNGDPFVPTGYKYFIAVPYDYIPPSPPENRTNQLTFYNRTRS